MSNIGKQGIPYVAYAPFKNGNGVSPIRVEEATLEIIDYWHENIQKPFINKSLGRADRGWNWNKIDYRLSKIGLFLNQNPKCYMVVKELGDDLLPLAILFQAENYPALFDKRFKSSFIWHMAAAPPEFLVKHISPNEMPSLGKICIDIGVTSSYKNLHNGVIGLHASPKGGARLRKFYSKGCNLANLSRGVFVSAVRPNDGNYFYADENIALGFSLSHDYLR